MKEAIESRASDIHLIDKVPPIIRVDGELRRLDHYGILRQNQLAAMLPVVASSDAIDTYKTKSQVDTAHEFEGTRFRVHIYRQKGTDAFALRLIPKDIPKLEDVNLPPVLRYFTALRNGLVLITGVTGSGKSTTLASLIDEINEKQSLHIVTVEDPIEFVHEHKKSIINQREVLSDVQSFAEAVRGAVREDPDILLVGEMRDLDTITNAITLAETGHLVFATLHTKSAAETVDRIIDVFPPNQQEQIRIQLSNALQGVVSQMLLPKIGGGRVPCCEVMIVTPAIRNNIRENSVKSAINDTIMMNNKKNGSQTMIQSLADLVKRNLISFEVARAVAGEEEFETLKKSIMS